MNPRPDDDERAGPAEWTGQVLQAALAGVPGPDGLPAPLPREALEPIAAVFRVFSEATRLQILQELKSGPRNVTALVEALGVSQANVSKQLRVLFDAGIIRRDRRGTQAIYAIDDPLTFELCNLVCQKLNREASSRRRVYAL
jgi:DNA-binding transcriptional ArsR family regulator